VAAVKPLVIFGDVQSSGADVLRTALSGRAEPFAADATVGTKVPTIRSPEDPLLPFVLVRKDGDLPHPSMANSRCTLRCTVWHVGPDEAHDLAMLCQGLLLVHSGDVIRGCRPATGPLPATDPDSGIDLSTFTVLANVKPQPITA
jgi:hypothetical protein